MSRINVSAIMFALLMTLASAIATAADPPKNAEPAKNGEPPKNSDAKPVDAPAAATPPAVVTEDDLPLYQQVPHDLIVVQGKGETVFKIFPLEAELRRSTSTRRPNDKVQVRFIDAPETPYSIEWRHVVTLKLFEDRVLEKAIELVAAKRFDEAFEYFDFLRRSYPLLVGLGPAIENYLQAEARAEFEAGHAQRALALLNDLYALNAKRNGLADEMAKANDALVDPLLKADDVTSARDLMGRFKNKFADHATLVKWRERLARECDDYIEQSRRATAAKEWTAARRAAHAAIARRPDFEPARKMVTELIEQNAQVTIAVRSPAQAKLLTSPLDTMISWSSRRYGRLLQRPLMELVGITSEGGKYRPLLGVLVQDPSGALVWQLPHDAPLTGYDLAQRLWSLADPTTGDFQPVWAETVSTISVDRVYDVSMTLRHQHLLPAGLLTSPLASRGTQPRDDFMRPYELLRQDANSATFQRVESYRDKRPTTPVEIVERWQADETAASAALLQGEVDLVDRLAPWEVASWRQRREPFVVGMYRVPSVHMLCVKRAEGLTKLRTFRRAMAYALDRQQLLDTLILRNEKPPGTELLSGPFPRGVLVDDPLGYAVNPLVKPAPFDPDLAATLFAVAQSEWNATNKEDQAADAPPLKLLYPATAVARRVIKAIGRQWEALGVSVAMEELPPGESGWDRDYDILYVEAMISEPLVDARLLLGAQALGAGSPYLGPLLDDLDRAANWSEARSVLHRIHQLVHDDASLLPLWQMPEFYVHHRSLQLPEAQPVSLYQDIEQWRLAPRLPPPQDDLWSTAKAQR